MTMPPHLPCRNLEYAIFYKDKLWRSGFTSLAAAQAALEEETTQDPLHIRCRPYGEWTEV